MVKSLATSMANSIIAMKKDVYKGKPTQFAGGLTLNISKCKFN